MSNSNDTQTLLDALTASQETKFVGKKPLLVVPHAAELMSLERHMESPIAHSGNACMSRVESFIDYVNDFKTEHSRLYIIEGSSGLPQMRCIFDDREKDVPSWSAFSVVFDPKYSRQLEAWSSWNGNWKRPDNFAKFLNTNRLDVVDPEAATLIEIIRDIRGTANVEFKEAVDEHTGAKNHAYAEKVTLKGGKNEVTVPTGFNIAIPIYERQRKRIRINCHLSAMVEDGKVMFCYEMDQFEEIRDVVIDELVTDVVAKTQVNAFYGTPAKQG